MKALVHRAAAWHSAQALYSNRTARTLRNVPRRRSAKHEMSWRHFLVFGFLAVLLLFTALFFWSSSLPVITSTGGRPAAAQRLVSRIAFGSSSAHDYSSQPVWVNGVIPSDPDAWIWVGDMAYMDEARVNCDASPTNPQCNCTGDWLHQPPYFCMSGNPQHAATKVQAQLANPDYAQFLAFMCPGHRGRGLHPPDGSNSEVCPKAILGTYDDHDYGWIHGNKRLPQKDDLKQAFLDAIGDPLDSLRRAHSRGIQSKYVLNEGKPGHEIDVILLDTRYYRDPLPCYVRRSFCEEAIRVGPSHGQYSWCLDFLRGGDFGTGSCCDKDEKLVEEWCSRGSSKWSELCDQPSPSFHVEMLKGGRSDFCEVLGNDQRKWLEDALLQSSAPLKLVVSSSVVLPTTQKKPCSSTSQDGNCFCTGDDWECYKLSQIHLLDVASKANGVVLLTGDLQYSDIRVLKPGSRMDYGGLNLSYPLYQVLSSGLAASSETSFDCDDGRKDPSGLRDHEECDFVRAPSFGLIEVVWEEQMVRLQVRDGMTNSVKLESAFTFSA